MRSILLSCLLPCMLCAGQAAESFREFTPAQGVLVLQQGPMHTNLTAIDTGPGLVVIDTWESLPLARKAKELLESRFGKPVTHVINTHHHWDHTFGNAAFPKATILGHPLLGTDMRRDYMDPGERAGLFSYFEKTTQDPDLRSYYVGLRLSCGGTFRLVTPGKSLADNEQMKIGNLSFRFHGSPGHTRNDLMIVVEELGLVFGRRELCEPRALPVSREDAAQHGRALSMAMACQPKVLIPGHGAPIPNPDLQPALAHLEALAR